MINGTKAETSIKVTDNIKKEDFEYVLETITYVKIWLILFAIIITKIILIKRVSFCKKIYIVHKERIIRQHSGTATIQA